MERNGFEMREGQRNTSERKVESVELKMLERGEWRNNCYWEILYLTFIYYYYF